MDIAVLVIIHIRVHTYEVHTYEMHTYEMRNDIFTCKGMKNKSFQ